MKVENAGDLSGLPRRRSVRRRIAGQLHSAPGVERAEAFLRAAGDPTGSDQAVSRYQPPEGGNLRGGDRVRHRAASAHARSSAEADEHRSRYRPQRHDGQSIARSVERSIDAECR
jgi:hypothetical protein